MLTRVRRAPKARSQKQPGATPQDSGNTDVSALKARVQHGSVRTESRFQRWLHRQINPGAMPQALMKAHLWRSRDTCAYRGGYSSAFRIASIGAARSNQISKASAP